MVQPEHPDAGLLLGSDAFVAGLPLQVAQMRPQGELHQTHTLASSQPPGPHQQ